MKKIFILTLAVLFTMGLEAQIRYLKGTLQGSQQAPANISTATGVVIVKLNTATNVAEVFGDYAGLTSAISGSHIHQAPAGANGGVIVTIANTGGTTGTLSGTGTITGAQTTQMLAGNTYINVHTNNNGGGEIRAQLSPATDMQTSFFNARIQGAQQVPPNSSAATGWANILLDKTNDSVFVTGYFTGLTAIATAAHIHAEQPGSNGGVIITLFNSASTTGAIHVASPISSLDKGEMIFGDTYINIHTSTNPGGEIRGQINQFSQIRYFKGVFQGSQQVPANASTAKGTVLAAYLPEDKVLSVGGDYQNLTSTITAAHIHSPALPGSNASVLFALTNTGGTSGDIEDFKVLTLAEEADLMSGKMYANVHNASFPGGEIRAQLTATSVGETQILLGDLQGGQQVPANGSTGQGYVSVILDKLTNEVFLSGGFSGLTANATAAHIHQAAAGTNGSVVVTLSATAGTSGSVTGSATVSQAIADAMIAGNTYVNIHNASFPGGELRAQLGNYTLPVNLTSFNGFAEGNRVTLVWQVAQEVNLSRYEIEQQNTERGSWLTKSTVGAKGESGSVSYKQTDYPLQFTGQDVFYRLKMIDKDGKYKYSPTVRISLKPGKAGLILLGNPVKDELRFVVTGIATSEKAMVTIVDMTGRILKTLTTTAGTIEAIDMNGVAPGVYRIIATIKGETINQAFVK